MSYHVYQSDAIIIGGSNHGESDRVIVGYTTTHGLIRLHAKSIREGRSKLRYAVSQFRIARVNFVRGKHGWRLTSAIPKESHPAIIREREKRMIVAQQFRLLKRMVHGEEQHHALYLHLETLLRHIAQAKKEQLRELELYFTVRMLNLLGYWGDSHRELLSGELSDEHFVYISAHRTDIVRLINGALRMTHL